MKKICLFSLFLLFALIASAQSQFSVPAPTMEQKYNRSMALMYNNILGLINIAKSDGMTAEELGKRAGEVYSWDKGTTFEQFVNFSISSWACMSDSVKIIEQSNEKVVITVPHIYLNLENRGSLYGVSLEELIAYFDAMMSTIAKSLNLNPSFKMTWGAEGMKIEVSKR